MTLLPPDVRSLPLNERLRASEGNIAVLQLQISDQARSLRSLWAALSDLESK